MKTQVHNPNCDGAHCCREDGEVRLLPIGGGGNLIVCRDCYEAEMMHLADMFLDAKSRYVMSVAFKGYVAWEELKPYAPEAETQHPPPNGGQKHQ